ncbi:hypothetical protein PG984_007093 [Apiospora sp. TS-2023a]
MAVQLNSASGPSKQSSTMTSKPVIQSPNPTRSRLCLVLATIVYTSLAVAWCYRDVAVVDRLGFSTGTIQISWHHSYKTTPGELYCFFWAMAVSVCASALLLGVHSWLRFEDQPGKWEICCPDPEHRRRGGHKDKRYGKFHGAACLCAGAMSACVMALYCAVWSQHGGHQYFFVYQGLMAFWNGYWVEWWTTILGNELAAYGC